MQTYLNSLLVHTRVPQVAIQLGAQVLVPQRSHVGRRVSLDFVAKNRFVID